MHYRLTHREMRQRLAELLSRSPTRRRLVALLLEGLTRKQIAFEMKRSGHTVDSHLKSIYRELGIGDRAQLMMLAESLCAPPPNFGDC